MRSSLCGLAATVSLVVAAELARAQPIGTPPATPVGAVNFDDLDASVGDVILTTYRGFTFVNFSAYTTTPGFPGFNSGIVSPANAAYSSDVGRITATGLFDFTSASFGSGYYDGLVVTVEGQRGGVSLYRQAITVGTAAAQFFSFNFAGVDALVFTTSTTPGTTDPYFCGAVGCSYFTIDDAVLTPSVNPPPEPPSTVPEPSSLALLAPGLLALGVAGRSSARARLGRR